MVLIFFEELSRGTCFDETEEGQKSYSDFSMYEPRFESGTSTFESGVLIIRPRHLLIETSLMNLQKFESGSQNYVPGSKRGRMNCRIA